MRLRKRSRRSALMEERSGLEQGRTEVAEGSKLKLQQENREGVENSKALAEVDSPPSIAMLGELHGGSRDSGASPFHMDYSEIPPSSPPQAPVQGPDRAALGISKAAEVSSLKPSTLAAPNLNLKAMPPPSNPSLKAMPPPSYTRKPNACLPDSQDTAFHSAQTTHPPRSSSFSDKLEDDHPSRESNLQLVVAPEPEEHFPLVIVEEKGPFHLSAGLQEPPSNQSAKGNQKEPSFADYGFSVESLRDNIGDHRSSPLEEKKKGSGGDTISDGARSSNGLPCPSCKSTNTQFCLPAGHYCDNCREYWTLGHLQQHEVQLPSKQSPKGKEKDKETPYEDADQFLGKGLGDSSRGPARSLHRSGSEDGNGGSNEEPLSALSCLRCKSTCTRLCTYGIFCDACGKHTPFAWSGSEDGNDGSDEGPLSALSCLRCKSTFTRLCSYGIFCDACGKHTPFAGTRDR